LRYPKRKKSLGTRSGIWARCSKRWDLDAAIHSWDRLELWGHALSRWITKSLNVFLRLCVVTSAIKFDTNIMTEEVCIICYTFRHVNQTLDSVHGTKDGNQTLFRINFLFSFFKNYISGLCSQWIAWIIHKEPRLFAGDNMLKFLWFHFFQYLQKTPWRQSSFSLLIRR
jgi:hypothetical protein